MGVTQGYLSQFQYGDQATAATSTTWTSIAQVLDIKPGKIEAKDVDVTVIDSPNQAEQFAPGWANGGEGTIKVQFAKAQQTTLFGLFRTLRGFRVMFNDASTQNGQGSTLAFDGYIKGIANEIDSKNLVTCELTVKVSGLPVFTAAA